MIDEADVAPPHGIPRPDRRGVRRALVRSHARAAATVIMLAGLLAAAVGVSVTSAAWTDAANFAADVRSASPPRPDAFVRVTAICRDDDTYRLRVRNESDAGPLDYRLQVGGSVVSGPHVVGPRETVFHDVPVGSNGVRAVPFPDGAWENTYGGTVSTSQVDCTPPTTTSTSPTTTTTVPLRVDAFVRVTAICRDGEGTYRLRVRNESIDGPLDYEIRRGETTFAGPLSVAAGETVFVDIPIGVNGVRAVPIGEWTNTYRGTASTPRDDCPPPDTSTTTATTTTTALPPAPPPSIAQGGISRANDHTVITAIDWTISTARQACAVVWVTGAVAEADDWMLRVDTTAAPWNGPAGVKINVQGTGRIANESATSVLITGKSNNGPWRPRTNNTPITNEQVATVTVCEYNLPVPPPADLAAYTVSQSPGERSETRACEVLTVTSNRTDLGSFPFFFGWVAVLDLNDAKAHVEGAGRTLNFVDWSPFPNGDSDVAAVPRDFGPPQDSYVLTSGYNAALRAVGGGADSYTLTACVVGF